MDDTRRKIAFHSFKLKKYRKNDYVSTDEIHKTINYIMGQAAGDRIEDIGQDRSLMLKKEEFYPTDNVHVLLFASFSYNYRPPVVDRDTGTFRDNPKTLREGDENHVHIVFQYFPDEIIVLLEDYRLGASIRRVTGYLNKFIQKFQENNNDKPRYRIKHLYVPQDDFLKGLNNATRVASAVLHAESSIIGSEVLNYSNRTEHLTKEVTINLRAQSKHSLRDLVTDTFTGWKDHESLRKIRVVTEDIDGNEQPLGAEMNNGNISLIETMSKVDYIYVNRDKKTGEIVSRECFKRMRELLK